MSIDLPTPIGLKLLSGLLGNNGAGGHGGPNGIGNVDGDGDNRADQARQSALQNERAGDASNEQGRWQTGGPGEAQRGNGPHHDGHGPQGPNNGNNVGQGHGVGHGHGHGEIGNLPNPGQVLSSALGRADATVQSLLGQNGAPPGLLAKTGELANNVLNQAGNVLNQAGPLPPPNLAAKALEATPLANAATAAGALLAQATAQALNAPGAQALAARNALHDAASAPLAPARDTPATLQSTHATQLSNTVPGAARAADSALLQGRQDLLPLRADQAPLARTATALPAGSPPPAAPMVAPEPARILPFAAPPPAVPASQSPALVEGRPNLVGGHGSGGDGSVGAAQKADMAQQTPPGHTGAAPARAFRPEEEDGESLAKRMIQAVAVWLGLAPAAAQSDPAEQEAETAAQVADDRWLRLQWLFWALAVAGYGCLAIAVIVFIPGGAGFLDETRNPIVRPALMVGLGCSIAAWWLARKIARSR